MHKTNPFGNLSLCIPYFTITGKFLFKISRSDDIVINTITVFFLFTCFKKIKSRCQENGIRI